LSIEVSKDVQVFIGFIARALGMFDTVCFSSIVNMSIGQQTRIGIYMNGINILNGGCQDIPLIGLICPSAQCVLFLLTSPHCEAKFDLM